MLISGRGSNLRAIAAQAAPAPCRSTIRAVISDRADAAGLAWAARRRLRDGRAVAARLSRTAPRSTARWPTQIDALRAGLVVLAGFMRILGDEFVDRFAGRLLNIHPSLLPAYRGLHTHRRVLEAGDRCTAPACISSRANSTAARWSCRHGCRCGTTTTRPALSARVLAEEHRIYPECIGWFAPRPAAVARRRRAARRPAARWPRWCARLAGCRGMR